jgi:ribose/xylose/arabinose/galactoside ABC-type transport system permease subunit
VNNSAPKQANPIQRLGSFISSQPLIVAGIALFILFSILQPNFRTLPNLSNIASQASVLLIAATGMTFIILTAGIDLSVGALVYLGGALATTALSGFPPLVILIAVPLLTMLLGWFNGAIVAFIGVPAMIVTLATLQVFRGLGDRLTQQQTLLVPANLQIAGHGTVLGIPTPFIIAIAVLLLGVFVLRRTVFGRRVRAIGSSRSAALNAGMPIKTDLQLVYAIGGLLAGVAATVQIGQLGAVQPTLGSGFELTVITAVVLGGTSLSGGSGGILGTALGAIVLTMVEDGLVLVGASPYIFDIVRGAVLLVALIAGRVPQRIARSLSRLRERGSGNFSTKKDTAL